MAAHNLVVLVFLGLLRLPSDAQATNVILTTVRDENVIEVSKTNRAVVLVDVPLLPIFFTFS